MVKFKWAAALSALTIAAGLQFAKANADLAFESHDCGAMPADAVMKLPFPLSRWAEITCTPLGVMMTSHTGWLWIMPDASGTVLIPSQEIDDLSEAQGSNKDSYFTQIAVVQVKGAEFEQAYRIFHIGFDDSEVKPDAYRVDLTSASGRSVRMFFFDYDTYAWGMSCPENKCDVETRFMILDKNNRPKPRQPSI